MYRRSGQTLRVRVWVAFSDDLIRVDKGTVTEVAPGQVGLSSVTAIATDSHGNLWILTRPRIVPMAGDNSGSGWSSSPTTRHHFCSCRQFRNVGSAVQMGRWVLLRQTATSGHILARRSREWPLQAVFEDSSGEIWLGGRTGSMD